ncbi:MAG: hypothetical protein ABI379_01105 [Rhodanobacter sp.]
MATTRRMRLWWLLATLVALFAVAFLWRYSDSKREATSPVGQIVANPARVKRAQSTSLAPAAFSRPTISADGTAAVPIRFQLANVSRVRTAPSFQEWLAQFPLDQQAKISAFDKAHFGVYRVSSREQVAWMAANGYPMPEDIVASESLADRDLLKLANQGNDKAAFLMAERQDKELLAFLAEGGHRSDYFGGIEGRDRIADDMTIDQLVKQSNSPYKGFLEAAEANGGLYADQGGDAVDVRVIAGLVWAEQLGDLRASQFVDDYVGGDPQRMVILETASVVSSNAVVDTTFMAHSGGQRPGAAGRGIPDSSVRVY